MNKTEALKYLVDSLELLAIPEVCCCDTEMFSDRLICPLCGGEAFKTDAKIEDADHDSSCPYIVARDALNGKSYKVVKYFDDHFEYNIGAGFARFQAEDKEKELSRGAGPNTKYYINED